MGYIPLKPTVVNGATVAAQNLTVSSSAVSFAAFSTSTSVCAIQILNNNVYCTFDGSTPSSSNGGQLFADTALHWDANLARRAKFIQVSATATLYCQECVTGSSSILPAMEIFQPSPS